MIDVLGPEKRRRRTTQEKSAIVQQSFEPGMTASLVARQHGVAASYFSGASNTRGLRANGTKTYVKSIICCLY